MHSNPLNRWRLAFGVLFLAASSAFPFYRFRNYSPPKAVRDVAFDGTTVWAASSGGLLKIDRVAGKYELMDDTRRFPDPKLTAVELDKHGNLWIGTERGYLYRLKATGQWEIHNSYVAAGWDITDLYTFGDLIIVGSSKGCGVFDPAQGVSTQNAATFGTLRSSEVKAVAVHSDTLYVGGAEGVATLHVAGGRLPEYNFFDPGIWHVSRTDKPVRDFLFEGSATGPSSYPTVRWRGKTYAADSTNALLENGVKVASFSSTINCIVPAGDNELWIGTETDYVYRWNGDGNPKQLRVKGLTFGGIDRVYVAGDGRVWLLPFIEKPPQPWYKRITWYDNDSWHPYTKIAGIGNGTHAPYFNAITEDRNGDIWIGTWGNGIKLYRNGSFTEAKVGTNMCTAVGQDSSGNIWLSNNYGGDQGCLFCYDPPARGNLDGTYVGFFKQSDPKYRQYYIQNIFGINVDVNGVMYVAAGHDQDQLVIFRHDGNPAAGESSIVGSVQTITTLGKVNGMTSTADGITWLAAGKGLYRRDGSTGGLEVVADVPAGLTAVAAETDSVVWVGIQGGGITRFELQETVWRDNSPATIDTVSGETENFSVDQRLISNEVTDLSIDLSRGYLWVATLGGLSRFDLGHSTTVIEDNDKVDAFPNPCSISRDGAVVFPNVGVESRLTIYSQDGTRVSEATRVIGNKYEWTYEWTPPASAVPGTYFYVVKSDRSTSKGKIMLIP